MEMQEQSVTEDLEKILRRFAPKASAAITVSPQTHLIDDFGIDSPRMIYIVLDVEDHFSLTIDDQEVQKIRTFGDLVNLVNRCARN